jgi:probable rRNA maturation factor
MNTSFKLDFVARKPVLKVDAHNFEPILKNAIAVLKKEPQLKGVLSEKSAGGTIQLILTSDEEIRLLNAEYRGEDKSTDVISLSYFDEMAFPGKNNLTGEIFISVDTAKKQAKEHKETLIQELDFLFTHGVLHIFGYNHEKPDDLKEMFRIQDIILKRSL